MIYIMGVTTVVPAQIYPTRRAGRGVYDPTAITTLKPGTDASLDSLATMKAPQMPRGFDEPVNPDTYIIGPGDQFVVFLRPQGTDFRLVVLPEGKVLVPDAGLVQAAGLTITKFREELKKQLASFYRGSEIHCQLLIPRTFVVYVLGNVANPGPVQLTAPFRADAAVNVVGGVTAVGSTREIEVRENGEVVGKLDLGRLTRLGDVSVNPMLHEGQSLYVPPKGPECIVTGEVWNSGNIEIVPGETAADMIELAGGFNTSADPADMVLERLSESGHITVGHLSESDLSAIAMEDGDVVVVPSRRSFPGIDFVRVQGGGGRDGRIYLAEGETLDSFRPRFIRLRNDYDLSNSKIERKRPDGSMEFIPVDLSNLVRGDTTLSVPLMPGDVINIPRLEDIVYVGGEVVRPGEVEFQRGLPAGRYIAMVGGPSDAGSIDKIEIFDDKGNKRDGDRNSVVYRGETILVKRRTAVILGNLFIGFVSLTSLFLSAYAVAQSSK